jgi:hypothetical protein
VGQIEFGGHDSTTALVDAKSGEVLDISPRLTAIPTSVDRGRLAGIHMTGWHLPRDPSNRIPTLAGLLAATEGAFRLSERLLPVP